MTGLFCFCRHASTRAFWNRACLRCLLALLCCSEPLFAGAKAKIISPLSMPQVLADADAETIAGFPAQTRMFLGDIKLFHLKMPIKTVAVGNGKVISASTIENGDLMVLAIDAGDTTIHVWNTLGHHFATRVRVDLKDMERVSEEVRKALGDTAGLSVRVVGDRVLIEGQNVSTSTSKMVDAVAKLYPQASNMTTTGAHNELLEPMILFDLHFIEFKKTALQNIGVKWDQQSAHGFNFGYFSDFILNDAQGNGRALPSGYTDYNPIGKARDKFSFNATISFGSAINLAISNGDAYVLAAPRLSTRSGGKAKFLSGGEVPLPSTSSNGLVNVVFKKYGIILDLEATTIGERGISGSVAAEVSSIDSSVSIQGLPGFLSRRTESEFNMRDGETLVLSGLMNKENAKSIDKMPLLGDVPILGEFFRNKKIDGKDTELVVFITPHIYNARSEVNQKAIARGTNGLNQTSHAIGDGKLLGEDGAILDRYPAAPVGEAQTREPNHASK